MRFLIAALVVACGALAWAFRWDVTPVSNGDRAGSAVMVNRWTGAVYIVWGRKLVEVLPEKPEP